MTTSEPCAVCGATEGITQIQRDCVTYEPLCPACLAELNDLAQAMAWALRRMAAQPVQEAA